MPLPRLFYILMADVEFMTLDLRLAGVFCPWVWKGEDL